MDPEEEIATAVAVYTLEKKGKKEKKRRKRSTWVKPWFTRWDALGFYNTLM